ncbi:discoidin domain-containing protein [Sphingobacterium griseoflavum]|uniref:F5/8 type C domain-containing protein n=1 Tax=Sphingobacterium griseoflavum TaxID=1474952 RepID=A0ABQ3HZD1_9SPHI|nr:discoidin domain-containing protein [Sphingobacterium griseoflavum]GHE39480.1 hypothetical protein GCM10017764_23400 [Sphingobacterium griseoflavum]
MIKSKLKESNVLVLLILMVFSITSCKEEALIFPPIQQGEAIVAEARPAARPSNLTVISAFNKQIEIYWPQISDRVRRAMVTYQEAGQLKSVHVDSFDKATIIPVQEIATYSFDVVYYTEDNTASKVTSFQVQSRPFETDFKVQQMIVSEIEGGVRFVFPDTDTDKEFVYTVGYTMDGEERTVESRSRGGATVEVAGLLDETVAVDFAIQVADIAIDRIAITKKSSKPGVLQFKRLLPSFKYYLRGQTGNVQWTNDINEPVTVKIDYIVGGEERSIVVENTDRSEVLSFHVAGEMTPVKMSITGKEGYSLVVQETIATEMPKSAWTAQVSSVETAEGAANGRAISLIDDNINTFWHSTWSSGNNPVFPHWFSIDFGSEKVLSQIGMIRRHNNTGGGFSTFHIEISNNGSDWIAVEQNLTFISNDSPAAWQDYAIVPVKTRFVRIMIVAPRVSTVTNTHLAEFRAFGY